MLCLFADDSTQLKSSRPGLGPVVSLGGIAVPEENLTDLRNAIDALCSRYGFPDGEEFKWSPKKKQWMRGNLTQGRRTMFFRDALLTAKVYNASAVVCIASLNASYRPAIPGNSPIEDATMLLLERANSMARSSSQKCKIVMDAPGGHKRDQVPLRRKFADTVKNGTAYSTFEALHPEVEFCDSHKDRLLQLADLVVSCTTARVAGEPIFSPPVFQTIRPLLNKSFGRRTGGYGLKIHPCKFVNLYYWLLGDEMTRVDRTLILLPTPNRPYFQQEGCDIANIV